VGLVLLGGIFPIFFFERRIVVSREIVKLKLISSVSRITHNRFTEWIVGIIINAIFAGAATVLVGPPEGYGTVVAFFTIFAVGFSRHTTHLEDLPTYTSEAYEDKFLNLNTLTSSEDLSDVQVGQQNSSFVTLCKYITTVKHIVSYLSAIFTFIVVLLSLVRIYDLFTISQELYSSVVLSTVGIFMLLSLLKLIPNPTELHTTERYKLLVRVVLSGIIGVVFYGVLGYWYSQSLLTLSPGIVLVFIFARAWGTNTTSIKQTEEKSYKQSQE